MEWVVQIWHVDSGVSMGFIAADYGLTNDLSQAQVFGRVLIADDAGRRHIDMHAGTEYSIHERKSEIHYYV